MWLLIDDERNLKADAIARTPVMAKKLLQMGGWDGLYLDHDLASYEDTGYSILTWGLENNLIPNKVEIVSSNPVGVKNMADALESAGYELSWDRRVAVKK